MESLVGVRRGLIAVALLCLAACRAEEKAVRATRVHVEVFEGRYGISAQQEFVVALRDAGHQVVEDVAGEHDYVVGGTVHVEGESAGTVDVRVTERSTKAVVHSNLAQEGKPDYEDTESAFVRPCIVRLRAGVLAAVEGRGKPRGIVAVLAFTDRTAEGRGQIGIAAAEQMRDLLSRKGVPVVDGVRELGDPPEVAKRLGAVCAVTGEVFDDGQMDVRLTGDRQGRWTTSRKTGGASREEIVAELRRALEEVAENINAAMR